MELTLPFFDIGILLSPTGERGAIDVDRIIRLSDGISFEHAQRIRSFVLNRDKDEVGPVTSAFKRGYKFLSFQESYLLIYAQIGDIEDSKWHSFPILRRCFLVSEEALAAVSGIPTAIINGLESEGFSISTPEQYMFGCKPYVLNFSWEMSFTYHTLKAVLETKAVQLITIFCKLSHEGRVQINSPELTLHERLQYLEAILGALKLQHRKLISFSTSNTNPQDDESARVIFVDSGRPNTRYEIKPTSKAILKSRPNGLKYILRLDDIVRKNIQPDLFTFISELRLPNTISTEPSSLGKQLDLMIEFSDDREKIQDLVRPNASIAPQILSEALGLSHKYRAILTGEERCGLIDKGLSYFLEQARLAPKPDDQDQLLTQILQVIADNGDLQDTNEHEYRTIILNQIGAFIRVTHRANSLNLVVRYFQSLGGFWKSLSEILLKKAFDQFVTDDIPQAVEAWWSIYQNNWLNKGTQMTLLEHLLSKKEGIVATLSRFASSDSGVDTLIWLGQDSLMSVFGSLCPSTHRLLAVLSGADSSTQGIHNLLDISFEELGRIPTWLQWGAQKLLEGQHYSSIGEVAVRTLVNQGDKGKSILKRWINTWIERPDLLELIDTGAYKWLYGLAVEEKNLKFAVIVVWSYYAKVSELPQFYTESKYINQIDQLLRDFPGQIDQIMQYAEELLPDYKPFNKGLFVAELLEILDTPNPQFARKYLVALLKIENDYLFAASVRRLIKHMDLNWLRSNITYLISSYLRKLIKSAPNTGKLAFDQLPLLSATVIQRGRRNIRKIYLREFHLFIHTLFVSWSIKTQKDFIKALQKKGLIDEMRIAASIYMHNLHHYREHKQ